MVSRERGDGLAVVTDILDGSVAMQAGLCVGDQVVAIDGVPVDALAGTVMQTMSAKEEQVVLTLKKGGVNGGVKGGVASETHIL